MVGPEGGTWQAQQHHSDRQANSHNDDDEATSKTTTTNTETPQRLTHIDHIDVRFGSVVGDLSGLFETLYDVQVVVLTRRGRRHYRNGVGDETIEARG